MVFSFQSGGCSVAISSTGSVALVGAYAYSSSTGTARAYRWDDAASTWIRLGGSDTEMAGGSPDEWAGSSVSISWDGSVALVGAPGPCASACYPIF